MESIIACGKKYRIIKLLGRGKGGYAYLAEIEGRQAVVKIIHTLNISRKRHIIMPKTDSPLWGRSRNTEGFHGHHLRYDALYRRRAHSVSCRSGCCGNAGGRRLSGIEGAGALDPRAGRTVFPDAQPLVADRFSPARRRLESLPNRRQPRRFAGLQAQAPGRKGIAGLRAVERGKVRRHADVHLAGPAAVAGWKAGRPRRRPADYAAGERGQRSGGDSERADSLQPQRERRRGLERSGGHAARHWRGGRGLY